MELWQCIFGQQFDVGRDCPVLGLIVFVAWLAGTFVYGFVTNGKNPQSDFTNFYWPQIVTVPVVIAWTRWCYQHPEQLVHAPWTCDMRRLWPFCLGVLTLVWALHLWPVKDWFQIGMKALEEGNRLRAEGRYEEAEAAFAKAKWILDHKQERRKW